MFVWCKLMNLSSYDNEYAVAPSNKASLFAKKLLSHLREVAFGERENCIYRNCGIDFWPH